VRTLIVDNYDSFTFNLFHLFAEVNGEEPVVVRNDEDFTVEDLRCFDNVVLSPGPGRPQRRSDFGLCADVIAASALPLLGVCLGHQGLCHFHGGEVAAAPEVRHGRLSPIVHRQADLFAGIPSPFAAVRYHSLAVTRLSADLEAIAWTADGVLMGVRHRRLPAWGVQFHPESIATEHGRRLAQNFGDLTRRWRERNPRPDPRRRGVFVSRAKNRHLDSPRPVATQLPHFRVLVRRFASDLAAERVYDSFYRASAAAFWLDSSMQQPELGRFSFMGDAGGPLARVVAADVWDETITVESGGDTKAKKVVKGSFFDWLDADLAARQVEVPPLPFEFALGWVGYLGYELKAETGGRRAWRSENPDAAMIFADRAIAFDHERREIHLLALAAVDDEAPASRWLADTERRLADLARIADLARFADVSAPAAGIDADVARIADDAGVAGDTVAGDADVAGVAGDMPGLPPPSARSVGTLELRHDRAAYLRRIDACQRAIQEGESYEVCLTNSLTVEGSLEPWEAYRYLRRLNPAPFGALLRFGGLAVLGCSPERFLSVSRDRRVESRPIKGTRRRSPSSSEDRRLRDELASSEKDRAENLMIVDLVRNDLGVCAEAGSVHVPRLFDVETYASAHQLVSTVRATLRRDRSAVRCVRAAFPGGSMVGAPKIRTMQILDSLEGGPRGVYAGALGYFSLAGSVDLSIAIRTLVVGRERATYGVGGAVVAQSYPADEYEETAVKAAAILRLFGATFPDCAPEIAAGAGIAAPYRGVEPTGSTESDILPAVPRVR
jgi:para-aminobenzoate synthetase